MPRTASNEELQRVTFTLLPETVEKLRAIAAARFHGRSGTMSATVDELIREEHDRMEEREKEATR